MKISNIVLASMVSATFLVSCKPSIDDKKSINEKKKISEKAKKDSIIINAQNCPACGMG
jgi:hypothetical protein